MTRSGQAATLEVVSDVICPWCYIGKRRLTAALELLGSEIDIQVIWKPYELNPDMPPGGMERRSYYAAKFGSAAGADHLIANISANARGDGLAIDYDAITRVPNTITAHRLIWFAGQFGLQDALVDGLFRAYFVDGRNIEDFGVSHTIGVDAGLNAASIDAFLHSNEALDTVRTEAREAHRSGIQGVPAFVFNGRYLFSGAQSPDTIALSIKRAVKKGL
jgi:predicted DsbA family dithiol-disulfide isomerase